MIEHIWKLAKHFIGTISAFLAGITAILYSVGFITERAHLNMLGILGAPIDNIEYLKAGGLFFLTSLLSIQTAIFHILSIIYQWQSLLIILVFIVILAIFLFKYKIHKKHHFPTFNVIKDFYQLHKSRFIKNILLSFSLLIGLIIFPSFFNSIKGNSNLLYYHMPKDKKSQPLIEILTKLESSSNIDKKAINFLKIRIRRAKNWESNKIRQYILEDDAKPLRIRFGLLFIWIILFSIFNYKIIRNENHLKLSIFASLIIFFTLSLLIVQILLLLINYGYMIQSNRYPVGAVDLIDEMQNESNQNLIAIIGQTDEHLTAYDRTSNQQVIIYRKKDIKKLYFYGIKFIFEDSS